MTSIADYALFTPLQLADGLTLKNRIVYGPTTRARADTTTRAPTERMCVYYEQRASAGLLLTEATAISEQGYGWWGAPALYTDEHADGWKRVVDRVHAKGGVIFLQMWHMGRQGHSTFNAKRDVVSASATRYEGGSTRNADGDHVEFETARALEPHEIAAIVEDYRVCAARAKDIGFDGVEIFAGNGYLLDQFLQSSTNQRTDAYGGSFENRYRFLGEVVDAVKSVWSADRIGVRLAPNGVFGGMGSADNFDMFTFAMRQLGTHGLAYLAVLDGFGFGYTDKSRRVTVFDAKQAFGGVVIANNSLTRETAEGVLRSGAADLAGFVRLYMANPDLVERFQNDWPLNAPLEYDFYWDAHKGDEGYNASPLYSETKKEVKNVKDE